MLEVMFNAIDTIASYNAFHAVMIAIMFFSPYVYCLYRLMRFVYGVCDDRLLITRIGRG